MRNEVGLQGTGFFTKDSRQIGTMEHSTNTGGLLFSYRFHIKRWLAADANYGFDRNTQENFTPGGNFNIQTNVYQATAALVANLPVSLLRLKPYVLAGTGALVFSPTGNVGGSFLGSSARPARHLSTAAAWITGSSANSRFDWSTADLSTIARTLGFPYCLRM